MIKFGTGGWRAIIGDDFTKRNVRLTSQALANYCLDNLEEDKEKAIVLGYDRRFLSRAAAEWSASIFAENGFKVYFIDETSATPVTMFSVGHKNLQFGVAITASHNPAEWNGIKFFVDGGRDAPVEVTNDIEERVQNLKKKDINKGSFKKNLEEGNIEFINPIFSYVDSIMNLIDVEAIKKKDLRVLLDPMHGSGKMAMSALFFNCHVRVNAINDNHDVLFGGQSPSPSTANVGKLIELVPKENYDIGVALDGDADRIGIVTETGEYVHANEILILLYYYLLEYKGMETPIVRNVATTHILDRIAREYGQEAIEVPVGFKNISEGMDNSNAYIGGESSGGLATKGHIMGKDGIYAAALITEMISLADKSITELLAEIYDRFGNLYMHESSYTLEPGQKAELQKRLFEDNDLPKFDLKVIDTTYNDGAKIYFADDSWILIRFSGTEPVIRIYSESTTPAKAAEICDTAREYLGISKDSLSR